MKPPINWASVKHWVTGKPRLGAVEETVELDAGRMRFELQIRGGAVRSRVDVIRLLLRTMIEHGFTFDAKAYRIRVDPTPPHED